ncbi:unnamed protein product [Lathyrus oleraceus]
MAVQDRSLIAFSTGEIEGVDFRSCERANVAVLHLDTEVEFASSPFHWYNILWTIEDLWTKASSSPRAGPIHMFFFFLLWLGLRLQGKLKPIRAYTSGMINIPPVAFGLNI